MDLSDSGAKYASSGKLMFACTIVLFFILIVGIFLHSCRHKFFHRQRQRQRRGLIQTDSTVTLNKGLRPSLLKFLPTFTYSSTNHRHLPSCAVCLSELSNGEQGRILPHCNHAFHSHCIDAWLRTHSNCPLCRTLVQRLLTEPGQTGFSAFPAPMGCPRKPLQLLDLESASALGPMLPSESSIYQTF
ncbi:hypothetical protein Fmac_028045 [Flemingia macrophylla]|uniref:RING-type domain-containing protein n=1 Tax=Flemingia macrophylla TaxID=520843 RepID=A0ABD1LJG0_9FABA